jgi:hypothetical protein
VLIASTHRFDDKGSHLFTALSNSAFLTVQERGTWNIILNNKL